MLAMLGAVAASFKNYESILDDPFFNLEYDMSNNLKREDFMTAKDKSAMHAGKTNKNGNALVPRTHQTCIAKTGVARPGKTAKDRARA